jgi:SAM-dependent methyltransferase
MNINRPKNPVSQLLVDHYKKTFSDHGPTSKGVDWGADYKNHELRLDKMLALINPRNETRHPPSLLDVGCGYGSLLDLVKKRDLVLDYTGIDLCDSMIDAARSRHLDATWLVGDLIDCDDDIRFDYVVCNGVFTQKLSASVKQMDDYLRVLVNRMFQICRVGIAFNVMTTHVNYMSPNLYYRNPIELLGWCMSELSSKIRIDHSYPLYEYTVCLYRADK